MNYGRIVVFQAAEETRAAEMVDKVIAGKGRIAEDGDGRMGDTPQRIAYALFVACLPANDNALKLCAALLKFNGVEFAQLNGAIYHFIVGTRLESRVERMQAVIVMQSLLGKRVPAAWRFASR